MFVQLFILVVLTVAVQSGGIQRNQTSQCFDHHKACPIWKKDGECHKNTGFMLTHCKFSCEVCDTPCFDAANFEDCSRWSLEGKCQGDNTVRAYCAKSCNTCGQDTFFSIREDCLDQNEGCKDFAKRGECLANPRWMLSNCAESCKACVPTMSA